MAAHTSILRFPPFSLDPQRHVVLRDDEDMALSPHLVDTLFHLASRHGELVTKDALLDEFWPDVHVTENTLTRAIGEEGLSPIGIAESARVAGMRSR